jgi:Mg/Co/Ni transporter MgtE
MPPDEASDVLGDLPAEKAKEILDRIEDEEVQEIQELLGYAQDTAGGLMTNQFIAYPPEITVKEAIEPVRAAANLADPVYQIYVADAVEKLIGTIPLHDLLLAEPAASLATLVKGRQRTVSADSDEPTIAGLMSKYNLIAVPVVDSQGRLLGVVTIDDIIDRLLPRAAKRKRKRTRKRI